MKNKLTRRKHKYKKNKKKSTRRNKIKMVGGVACEKIFNIPHTYLKNYHFHYKKKLYHLKLDCNINLLKDLKDYECYELIKKIKFIENDTFNIEGHEIKGSIDIHDKRMAVTKELHKKLHKKQQQKQNKNPYEKIINLLKNKDLDCGGEIELYRKDPINIYFRCGSNGNFTLITLNTLNVLEYNNSDINEDKFLSNEYNHYFQNYMEYIKNFDENIVRTKNEEIKDIFFGEGITTKDNKQLLYLKQSENQKKYNKLLKILSDNGNIDYDNIFYNSPKTDSSLIIDATSIPTTAKDLYDFYVNYQKNNINLKSRINGNDQGLLKKMNKFKDYSGMRDANEYYKRIVEDLKDISNNYKTELIPKDECWNLTTPKFSKWSAKKEDTFGYKLDNYSNIINIYTTKQGSANTTNIEYKITIDNNEYILLVVFDNPPGHHICYINIGKNKFVKCDDSNISESTIDVNTNIKNHNFLIYGKLNPNQKFERKLDTVKGIMNNGATCFFNTAVQAFVHVTYFLEIFKILN